MSTNKYALIRYKVLDKCFRNPGKRYFIDDLISECEATLSEIDPNSNGISRRQIFDDISFMESPDGWSIELDRHRDMKKVYYRYSDISFSINNMPLNEVEINQLKSAIDILSQFDGMPQFNWINEMLPKLQQGITTETASTKIMEFDSNPYLKGIEFLGILHNAIFYKKVLAIKYQSFNHENSIDLVIHPYFLKQYNNRWFLFGHNPQNNKDDWNLALDRMIKIEEIQTSYKENVIEWNEYFEDIIGVTKPENSTIENIILHFKGITGKYIETKPIHGSQKDKWLDNDTLEVSLELIINYEFHRLILSYAENVIVIKPKSLINDIKKRVLLANQNYS